jgi:5-methylcytosine-specific restriction endonuclease McrA
MITECAFQKRAGELWRSQQSMARGRGQIEFSRADFDAWLWLQVGVGVIRCPHCGAPIDALSLTIDHMQPRSAGGLFSLENMECICQACNQMKGNLTRDGFAALLNFARTALDPVDQFVLHERLLAAHHGAKQRYWRDRKKAA